MKYLVACQIVLGMLLAVTSAPAAQSLGLPSHVTIDANYPANVVFQVRLFGTESIQTQGKVPSSFAPRQQSYGGSVDIWFAGMDGKFRIYASKGDLEERDTAGVKTQTKMVPAGGKIEFDGLGHPKKSPSDPADLIPIFPSKPVAAGDHWTAKALVAEPLGTGEAQYVYTVEAISLAEDRHMLASLRFNISASVAPPPSLQGWTSTITGDGRLDWDTTAHQRVAGSYRIVYSAQHGASGISETWELTERVVRIK
ncbi:MAG: hypothetical protein ACRD3T_02530 [Terriglobia bacterium]